MFERRKNLTGTTITDTVLPWPPITIVEKDDQGELYQSGITCALFNHCTIMSYASGNSHNCNLPSYIGFSGEQFMTLKEEKQPTLNCPDLL